MATIFSLSSVLVMPFWFLIIIVPHWRWTKQIIQSPLVIVAAALLYAALVLPLICQVLPAVLSPTLPGITTLLASPVGATIAWVHFLAFDLFVGCWVYLDSRERSINVWLMAPILFFVLMLGPLGFLLYMICRMAYSFFRLRRKQAITAVPELPVH